MSSAPTVLLVVGASGMLGHALVRYFGASPGYRVHGSLRSPALVQHFAADLQPRLHVGVDVEDAASLARLVDTVRPHVIVNCVGLVKQLAEANDPLAAIPINSLLPHRLARLAKDAGSRLVHISTDCVFSGDRGMYREEDLPDATDLYGRSKLLGEVAGESAITLRTSIIGHELASAHGLIGWFLAQHGRVSGYSRAIFSGLPTVELARVIRDFVLPRPALQGLYHVSADPINKLDLLRLAARAYKKDIAIEPDERVRIDRSLDSSRFRQAAGYSPPPWPQLVDQMQRFG